MIKTLILISLMTIDINYKLPARLPHQKAFCQTKARGSALVTGYGGGKSYIHASRTILHSAIDNGIPHMMVSPSFPIAKKTLIPAAHEILQKHYGLRQGKDYRYNKSDHEFNIYKWNGLIWVGSGSNPDSLNGPNLGSFGIDEPGQQEKIVFTKMIGRLRAKAKLLQYWLTGTPEGLNWFYDVCEGDEVPKDFELFRGKTTDNIHLPQSFIDDLYDQYDKILVDAYINGEFVNMSAGSAYYSFSSADYKDGGNVLDNFVPDLSKPLLIGQDFNYDPMCTVIGQESMIDGKPRIVIFDELYLHNADTDAAFERLISNYGTDYLYFIYPDPACYTDTAHGAAKSDVRLIKNAFAKYSIPAGDGYNIAADRSHPRRKDRLNSVNKNFKNSSGYRRLLITKNCKNLKNDCVKCTMEEYLNGRFKDPALGHITDALGYLVHKRYPVKIDRYYEQKVNA